VDNDHQIDQAIEHALAFNAGEQQLPLEQNMDADRTFADLAGEFQDLATEFAIAHLGELKIPTDDLRRSVIAQIASRTPSCLAHYDPSALTRPMVVTDVDGYVQWISDAFTDMCGYTMEELRGKKPGSVLQGPDTDTEAVKTMSNAVHAHEPVMVELVNYHKNGEPYRVRIEIEPVFGEDQQPMAFVAQEEKLESLAA